MRKIVYSVALAAIAAFAATSCVKEDFSSGNVGGGEVEFTVSASLPGAVSTYGSEQGGINNVDNNSYKLRYILEVYTDEATPRLAYKTAKYADNFTTPVSFSARLLALDYNFVFWADFIPNDNAGTDESTIRAKDNIYHTNSEQGLQAITIADSRAAGTDVADAYYCVEEMDLTGGSVSKKDIRLRRPFGKIRLVATDKWDGELQDNEPKLAEVAYSADLMVPNGFNALTKEALGTSIDAGNYVFSVSERADVKVGDGTVSAYILGIDYIFASQDRNVFNFNVVTRDASGAQIGYREISNVPVAENKLTTVMGNFFTNEGTIEVIVDDEFDGEGIVDVEEYVFPGSGAYNNNTGESFDSLADAIKDACDNPSGDEEIVITVAPETFDEVIASGRAIDKRIRVIGADGARVRGLNINSGEYEFDNIVFYGRGGYATGSTVYVGNTANVTLKQCDIDVEEEIAPNGRPLETGSAFAGSFILDGCEVNTNGKAGFAYLNAAAEDGNIQILNSTFDNILAAEYYSTGKYAAIEGNTFAATVDFTPTDAEKTANSLTIASKKYVNAILAGNTFTGENKVAAYFTSEPTYYNEPIAIGSVVNETLGQDYASIREAVMAAEEGNTIVIAEGSYDLGEPGPASLPGAPNGYYLLIDKKDLTLRGEGQVEIYTSHDANTGALSLQNLVTVRASGVTLENIVFKANYNSFYSGANKTIEVVADEGNGFTLRNCTLAVDGGSKNAGCLYLGSDSGNTVSALVEGCTFVNSAVNVRVNTKASVTGCTFKGVREDDGWYCDVSVRGKAVVEDCVFEEIPQQYMSSAVIANGNGFINLVNCSFPTQDTYWTENDNGVVLINGVYPFSGGSGTYEDPYKLSTPEDILMIGKLYTSGNFDSIYSAAFEMTCDIDISDTPVRNLGVMGFLFDGNGHTLTVHLTSDSDAGIGNGVGLFAQFNGKGHEYIYEGDGPDAYELNGKKYIIKGGCIRDLVIEGTVESNVDGAVASLVAGSCTGYIINVTNNATIKASNGASFVGGIVSSIKGTGLIFDCTNNGDITVEGGADARPVGGITAQAYGGSECNGTYPDIFAPYSASVNNCVNNGNITTDTYDVGGIMGQTHGYGNTKCITNCTNTGNISGTKNVGGILGRHGKYGGNMLLKGNVNSGNIVSGDSASAGQIYGKNEGSLIEGSQSQN